MAACRVLLLCHRISRTAEGSQGHAPLARTRHKRPRHVALRMRERDRTWRHKNHKRKKVALRSISAQSSRQMLARLLARRQAESSKQERQASPRHRRAQGSAGLHQYCSSSRCRALRRINRPAGGDRKHEQHTLERAQRHSWCHEWGKAACARHGEPARDGLRPHARRGCCGGRRLCFCGELARHESLECYSVDIMPYYA